MAAVKKLKSRQEKNQREARKDSKAAGKIRLKRSQTKTKMQPRKDSKRQARQDSNAVK